MPIVPAPPGGVVPSMPFLHPAALHPVETPDERVLHRAADLCLEWRRYMRYEAGCNFSNQGLAQVLYGGADALTAAPDSLDSLEGPERLKVLRRAASKADALWWDLFHSHQEG